MNLLQKFRVDGRTALVTGSSRGIGRAIALGLAEGGATVVVHGTQDSPELAATLAAVRALSPRSSALTGDLAAPATPARLLAAAQSACGAIDILVLNASFQVRRAWAAVTDDEAHRQMQINFHASLRFIQAVVPAMREKKWGRILTIGSTQQHRPHPDMIVYAASKSAQENLVRNLAKQLGPEGITVNNLSPGTILTDRNVAALADSDYAERVRAMIPLRAFGTPEDCAGTALLLCSEAGRYITGADFRVDGGMSLP